MKKLALLLMIATALSNVHAQQTSFKISEHSLRDKIKGGWAGQTIGVTFGGPYEFQFCGTFIGDYQPLLWYDGYLKKTMVNNPGLYDDLYMDLTFVEVLEKYGMDAPVDSFAQAFAHAGYMLWHANQAARYNILHGIPAPQSGYWKNNPHADCIDYQIESDFAGLMSPGMPNTASAISDKIGHIMNYGDGWYGGVFVGAMYSLAFVKNDLTEIVESALQTIPQEAAFRQCIQDVLNWHARYPDDWKQTWFEVQRKWANDIGCPEGVFLPLNIDAKVNAAYVVMALLYGNNDFSKTLEIATRCGQDADCNPSSAGGILGTVLGYEKIPAYWKMGLQEAEEIDFKYTHTSLSKVYTLGYAHATQTILKNGGSKEGNVFNIPLQTPAPVRMEQSFEGLYPVEKKKATWSADRRSIVFEFDGTGFVLRGDAAVYDQHPDFVFDCSLFIDGKKVAQPQLPADYLSRRYELCWNYDLSRGHHRVELKIQNPQEQFRVRAGDVVIYDDRPAATGRLDEKVSARR